jgi:hypothetical protein
MCLGDAKGKATCISADDHGVGCRSRASKKGAREIPLPLIETHLILHSSVTAETTKHLLQFRALAVPHILLRAPHAVLPRRRRAVLPGAEVAMPSWNDYESSTPSLLQAGSKFPNFFVQLGLVTDLGFYARGVP